MEPSAAPLGVQPVAEHVHAGVPVRKYRLDNGLTIIVWEDHQAPVASYQTWFKVGSADEEPGKTGMAHLFEHLMFKETSNIPEGEFDRMLESVGVNTNAATWADWTYYRENLPAAQLDLVMRLEADRMENMVLSSSQLETEREVVLNERLLRVDNDPEGRASEILYDLHFANHPYGHPTIGWMEDIRAISLEDCIAFYRHYYSPSNAAVVVVGDVDTSMVLELAARYYGHLEPQPRPALPTASMARRKGEHVELLRQPVTTTALALLYDAPAADAPGAQACQVLVEMLANMESAPLRRRLVEEEELATDLGAWHLGFRLDGCLEFQLNLAPGADWRDAVAIVDEECDRLVASLPDTSLVERGRNRRELGFLRSNFAVGSRANGLGHFETTVGDFSRFFDSARLIAETGPEDIRNAAGQTLVSDARTVVVSIPAEDPAPEGGKDLSEHEVHNG